MTWPNVNVSQKNRFNGTTNDVERVILFVGYGDTNIGKTQSLNTGSDLDKALGDKDSPLKNMVAAAANNAGQRRRLDERGQTGPERGIRGRGCPGI